MLCNASGPQPYAVTRGTGSTGQAAVSVTVGAVTVRVHTSEALRAYLSAWTRAGPLAAVLDTRRP